MATVNTSVDSGKPAGEEQNEAKGGNVIHNYYVNNVGRADNCNFGVNHGHLIQNKGASTPSGSSSGAHGREAQLQESPVARPLVLSGSQQDILALLNPIPDASHTRNRKRSPPNSACFPGTRKRVIKRILSWVNSSLLLGNPHIMWVYGYAGCGKSAIAQAIAEHLAGQKRLAASFFFFRGTGDRSRVIRFALSVAHQIAAAIPATAPFIEAAIKANTALVTADTVLSAQFEYLVYEPIDKVKWDRLASSLRHGPYLIVLDGLDECGDYEEIAMFIKHMITFFERRPFIPLRFLVTSRVESHIHKLLHSSKQVNLLNLVAHTSDADISTALDVVMAEESCGLGLAFDQSWPSPEDKARLVKHIGRSFIFLTTIVKLLLDPYTKDGLTPMERLPLILSVQPDFDGLYRAILEPSQTLPHFQDIVSTIALAQESLSIAQIADLLDIKAVKVASVLMNLHAIMQVPGDDHTSITLCHTSLRDFLCSKTHSGSLHAPPAHHRHLAYRCITLSASSSYPVGSPIMKYSRRFALDHWACFMQVTEEDSHEFRREVESFMMHLQTTLPRVYPNVVDIYFKQPPQAPNVSSWADLRMLLKQNTDIDRLFANSNGSPELEIASRAQNWKAVHGLVNENTNINGIFNGRENGILCVLHAACYYKQWDMVYLLLDKGADPNIISPRKYWSGFLHGTPLSFAARQGDVKLVTRLLNCGANPNLQGGFYDTALQAACEAESLEVVNLLLDNGADPNLQGGVYGSALHACVWNGQDNCVLALLLHKADPNIRDKDGITPLHKACYSGKVKVVKCLLEFKADASIKNNKGQTALQAAQAQKMSTFFPDRQLQDIIELLFGHGVAS